MDRDRHDDDEAPLACATGHVRLFVAAPLGAGQMLELDGDQSHYVAHVMRLTAGSGLLVFNGQDGEWRAALETVGKRRVTLRLVDRRRVQDRVPDLTLIFAPVKRARLDFLVQKATELGVAAIRPVMTRRTQVARVNADRLRANVIEAAEQCGRLTVPEVSAPRKLEAVLNTWSGQERMIFCDEAGPEDAVPPLLAALDRAEADRPWSVLIGPEGGFDAAERARLAALPGVVRVSLGPRIMRADTAAIAALTLWQARLGDLREIQP